MMTPRPTRIIFLCTGNSCRSQMAEGFARHLGGDSYEVYSAGLEAHGLNPRAVAVMAEVLARFRAVRDEIRRRVEALLATGPQGGEGR